MEGNVGDVVDFGDGVVDVGELGDVTFPSLFSRFIFARRFLNQTCNMKYCRNKYLKYDGLYTGGRADRFPECIHIGRATGGRKF